MGINEKMIAAFEKTYGPIGKNYDKDTWLARFGVFVCGWQSHELHYQRRSFELREKLANLCHQQWVGWMSYLFSKGVFNEDGTWTMPKEFVERWMRQTSTPYENLSHPEQESDRKEADKFLAVINHRAT